MAMLLTTVGFLALTGLVMWRQVRRAPRHAADDASRPCPRCGTAVPAGAMSCPRCGVPQQAYELVQAPAADAAAPSASGEPRALVRADMCVGCGACVAACPEPDAITLRGKLAVVDNARCRGHGECVAACPVGAIAVTTGAAVNRVTVPLVDANFQCNIPGLYIVGELGGRGLIKNAINEGKLAVEHLAVTLAAPGARDAGDLDAVDVVVVGSGPAGLSAAITAQRAGLRYRLLEQGSLADSVRKYPRHKLLLAEPVSIPLYGDLWVSDTSKEGLLRIWETVVASAGLVVQTGEKVDAVRSGDGLFEVETGAGVYRSRRVVLAMGRRGTPRRLGVAGEDLGKVCYDVVEMEQFAGRRVLVVGGGDSAIETAVGLANQAGTEVTLSYRGAAFARIKPRNQAKLDAVVRRRRVELLLETRVREIRDDVVIIDGSAGTMIRPNDDVVIRIGGDPPHGLLERIGVRLVQKDVPLVREPAQVS